MHLVANVTKPNSTSLLEVHSPPTVELIGRSEAMERAKGAARNVAAKHSTVLLTGETGTGKEMLARYIHTHSQRASGPFIPVDCSAVSEHLFESQLFGHVKGAFTGATRDTLGFVRAADGGTLFLDEIGELSLNLQSKLLRVIQERQVVPVGAVDGRPVDVRLISATNRDLRQMVQLGTFRQDLFFRLHVVTVEVPPLRARHQDVIELSNHFLQHHAETYGEPPKKISPEAGESLMRYAWPGNVRELFNALEHSYVMSEGSIIELTDLPSPLNTLGFPGPSATDLNLDSVERRTIIEALKRTGYNRAAACRLLGIEPRRLNRRIDSLNIPFPDGMRRNS
jgi:transcriptional regulator with PAS, ATPase and Fis domain